MGIISAISALGGLIRPATDLSRVIRGDKAEERKLDHAWREAVLQQLTAEFAQQQLGLFDRIINGLNRLPRPALALGTLGLFVFAMADPVGFADRMQGLALVPEPLWWLLGAIVSFYFGAREMHYFRNASTVSLDDVVKVKQAQEALGGLREEPQGPGPSLKGFWGAGRRTASADPAPQLATDPNFNAALEEWRSTRT